MAHRRTTKLDPPVDPKRDHVLGNPDAELTLVEYGNCTRRSCHAAHEVIAFRSGALPVVAAFGDIAVPVLIYLGSLPTPVAPKSTA